MKLKQPTPQKERKAEKQKKKRKKKESKRKTKKSRGTGPDEQKLQRSPHAAAGRDNVVSTGVPRVLYDRAMLEGQKQKDVLKQRKKKIEN